MIFDCDEFSVVFRKRIPKQKQKNKNEIPSKLVANNCRTGNSIKQYNGVAFDIKTKWNLRRRKTL